MNPELDDDFFLLLQNLELNPQNIPFFNPNVQQGNLNIPINQHLTTEEINEIKNEIDTEYNLSNIPNDVRSNFFDNLLNEINNHINLLQQNLTLENRIRIDLLKNKKQDVKQMYKSKFPLRRLFKR